jgi:hypothetical protein
MKIVAQNCLTKEYLTEQGTWDPAPAKAKQFDSSMKAYEYCRLHKIPDAQVVLKFSRAQFDVKLPVSDNCKEQMPKRSGAG